MTTSVPITSFKRAFERSLNRDMRQDRPSSMSRASDTDDSNIKKHHDGAYPAYSDHDEEDAEVHEKKDRPPRFSTVFSNGPAPAPVPVMVEQDSTRRRRGGGVFIPWPLFILLAILFFLETTFLFAYTIIGLYNNRPAGFLPQPNSQYPQAGCNCADRQAGINIAPNFVLPGGQSQTTVTVTTTAHDTTTLITTAIPSTTSTSSIIPETITVSATSTHLTIVTGAPLSTVVSLITANAAPKPTTSHTTPTGPIVDGTGLVAGIRSALSTVQAAVSEAHSTTLKTTTSPKPTPSLTTKHTTSKTTSTEKQSNTPLTLCDPPTFECIGNH